MIKLSRASNNPIDIFHRDSMHMSLIKTILSCDMAFEKEDNKKFRETGIFKIRKDIMDFKFLRRLSAILPTVRSGCCNDLEAWELLSTVEIPEWWGCPFKTLMIFTYELCWAVHNERQWTANLHYSVMQHRKIQKNLASFHVLTIHITAKTSLR